MINWVSTNLANISHQKIIFTPGFEEKIRFFEEIILFYPSTLNCNSIVNKRTVCMNPCSFHFLRNRCNFRYKSMKSVKIKINRWTKRACHRFLPIDRYKSDLPIFIDLLIDKSIPIFIDWLLRHLSDGVCNDVIHFLLLGNFRLKAISHQQCPTWFFCGRFRSR